MTEQLTSPAAQIVGRLKEMFPEGAGLHEPHFAGNEWAYVKECIDTRWVSSVGKFVDRLEKDLAAFTGAKRAVVVVNGTAALQMCLRLVGVRADDEVLIPALTFAATANAVAHLGAVPHIVDCEAASLGLDAARLDAHLGEAAVVRDGQCFNRRTGRRIRALVPMHTFGHPVDLDAVTEVAARYRLELVEDAAESLGSYYKGRHTGNWGKVSALSFNGNKLVTTGGGGAILTNDEELGALAKHLTTTAKVPHRWEYDHDQVGFNYRMPNLNAALGCAQLEQITGFLEKKRALADRYAELFGAVQGAKLVREPSYARSNYWLNGLLLDESAAHQRDAILKALNDAGILARPAWKLMHKLRMYRECPRMELPVAESLEQRLINIPSSVFL